MARLLKKILFIVLVLMPAARYELSARSQQPADYRPYFQTVKRALEQTAAEDFTSALNTYRQLFRHYRFAFPRDVFNALQLAIYTNNVSARDSLVRRGAESGVNRKTFMHNPKVLEAFMPADSLLFEQLFLTGRAVWATRVDTSLRREMIGRYKYEQASKSSRGYRSICTDNFRRIAALAAAGRFPGEARIGVADNLVNNYVIPTLCHYPFSYKILQKELHDAMVQGQLQPCSLMYVYGFNQSMWGALYRPGTPRDTITFAKHYNTGFDVKSADTAAVNRARAEMFMVSLDTEVRLEAVSRKHGLAIELGW